MRVAEIQIICGRHSFGQSSTGVIGFDNIAAAKAEFDRLAELLQRREDRKNDLEKTVRVTGIGEYTCPLDEITSVGLSDFEHANQEQAGMRDAFPNLFKI